MPEIFAAKSVLQHGQRMEFFLDGMDEGVLSRIEDFRDDKLIVAMPIDSKMRPVIPPPGEYIYGAAIGQGCRYRFFTTFRDKAMENVPVWIVDMPETVEKHQNREFVRVSVNLPIKVRVMSSDGAFGPLTETRMIDISGSGLAFSWSQKVKDGTSVSLEMNNIPGIGTLNLMGMAVRCMTIETDTNPVYLVGVRMMNLTRPLRNKLIKYIFDLQRQSLAKGLEP